MGLGKTVQIITLLSHLSVEEGARPFLVTVPNSTIGNCMSLLVSSAGCEPDQYLRGSRICEMGTESSGRSVYGQSLRKLPLHRCADVIG